MLDWFQDNKNIPLGTSISKEALRRSQEFERLEKEVETLRESFDKLNKDYWNLSTSVYKFPGT